MLREGMKWSKPEKEIARRAFNAAYNRECDSILQNIRKNAMEAKSPAELWQINNYLTEKRKEADEKYDFRYSVIHLVFARLIYEGWMQKEDLEGISKDKFQEIQKIAEFYAGLR